jgi:hypothetical protein
MKLDSDNLCIGIAIGNGQSLSTGGRTTIENVPTGADHTCDKLRGFILNHAEARTESGRLGDVPVLNSSRRRQKGTGSKFNSLGAEPFFCFGTAKTDRGHWNRLVVAADVPGSFEPVSTGPAFDEPQRVRAAGRESLGRSVTDLGWVNLLAGQNAGREFPQDGIDEWGGGAFARAFDEFNTFIDSSAGGNAAKPAELVHGEAESDENLEIELGERLRRAPGN